MGKKVVIVGGVAGGATAAARIRRLDENAEIIMFERGPHVSFSNCALPYFLSGAVEKREKLLLMNPEKFHKRYRIDARVNSEVIRIHRQEKKVTVKDVISGKTYEESYDKLILSPGASPIKPNIEGIDRPNVFTIRNVADITALHDYIYGKNIKNIAVIGGGFIGVEAAENLRLAGFNVALIEASKQILMPFDDELAAVLHKEMTDEGVQLILEDGVKKIGDGFVETESGKKIAAEAVVVAIGVRPETKLAEEAVLEIGELGGIVVDHNYLTSDPDIYAVGDAIEVYHRLTHQKTRLALAGPAQRQARAAADHMYGINHQNRGVIGSFCVKVFSYNAAATGLNEKEAKRAGISYDTVYIIPNDKVGIMPNSQPIFFKLIYEYPTGKILGAQAVGKGNVDKRIDVIAAMIMMDGTLEDLKDLELCYSPVYSTARDVVNVAAMVALNKMYGGYKEVSIKDVRRLVEEKAFIVDVRERVEFERGHIKTAVNIPLSEFRERVNEIPKDRPVYLHCRSGQSSYVAARILLNLGYSEVYNMAGSFLALSYYEYFEDMRTGREKIVTQYNFC